MAFERFNTQPPEGGWRSAHRADSYKRRFQHTAARRRLVAEVMSKTKEEKFQHTAARRRLEFRWWRKFRWWWFQHTAARRRLVLAICENQQIQTFQHTAARRRLVAKSETAISVLPVSTHSRPKAAGCKQNGRFN